jgi:hypothetical protein
LLYIAVSVEQYCDITRLNALPENEGILELNAAIRSLVAPLQLLGRVMWSEKNSTGHADDVATANGHNTPQSIS